jgi:L-aspartate oxidase
VDFEFDNIEKEHHDVVIIGSGIAGVYTALQLSEDTDIAILTKETLETSNSVLAQGGIAVSLDKKDSPELHFDDTIYAGAGLCDEDSVKVLVNEAAENIRQLCDYGVNFDKTNDELALSREAAHSHNRIIHAGDTTGKAILDELIAIVRTRENIKIYEKTFAIDIITDANEGLDCKGVLVCDETNGSLQIILSNNVVLATGGFGQIYSNTTNPEVATGDGVCMAYRAGAPLMDLEFVQFHPTVFYHPENKSFLISEAVRGEGAQLKNAEGRRFMHDYHPMGELAPRDVVSRAIFNEMKKTGSENVFLDITVKGEEFLKKRFPNIYETCLSYGIDMAKDYIPVAPAEHYCMGGIKVDVNGMTNIEGLFACGECACNGLHGANRLASNSLLEGLVFGRIIARQIQNKLEDRDEDCTKNDRHSESDRCCENDKNSAAVIIKGRSQADEEVKRAKTEIREEMTQDVGIIRSGENLKKALNKIETLTRKFENRENTTLSDLELQNILLLSRLLTESALEREESRGAHYRTDFPETDNENWRRHISKSIS